MRIWGKRKTIEFLEKLRVLNFKSAFIYKIALGRENRLILKNFYFKLYRQKLEFVSDLDEKIEHVKKEISPIHDPKLLAFYKRKKCKVSHLYLKYKMQKHSDIHRRELKTFNKYQKYLSKISHARVREILLAHRHKVKLNLREMDKMGITKFPIA